jgi:hypothetical protein
MAYSYNNKGVELADKLYDGSFDVLFIIHEAILEAQGYIKGPVYTQYDWKI